MKLEIKGGIGETYFVAELFYLLLWNGFEVVKLVNLAVEVLDFG